MRSASVAQLRGRGKGLPLRSQIANRRLMVNRSDDRIEEARDARRTALPHGVRDLPLNVSSPSLTALPASHPPLENVATIFDSFAIRPPPSQAPIDAEGGKGREGGVYRRTSRLTLTTGP